jgi:hypothetical protein
MGSSSTEYERQIAGVRGSMESRIVELRERSRDTLQRTRRAMVLAAAVGAGLGAAAMTAIFIYRLRRPPSFSERMERALPSGWWNWLRNARDKLDLGFRKTVPPVRLYVGDQAVGEQPAATTWERIAVRAAQAAGTAMAGAIVTRVLGRVGRGGGGAGGSGKPA